VVKSLFVNCEDGTNIGKLRIHKLISKLKKDLSFNISSLIINFISSESIFELNKIYLRHNYPTDIITFNYSGSHSNLDGELFISVEEAEINANRFKVSLNNEISRLVIHGILHLLNYDDKKKSNRLLMKRKENELLKRHYFV